MYIGYYVTYKRIFDRITTFYSHITNKQDQQTITIGFIKFINF